MDPGEALLLALEDLVGTVQPVDVEVPADELDVGALLERPGMVEAITEEAGYGTAAEVRGDAEGTRRRRSYMRRLQRYRDRGQTERRRPDAETRAAIEGLGLNIVRRRRTLGAVGEIVEQMIRHGVTVVAGATLTVLITSPKKKGRGLREPEEDERERSGLPAVFVSPGELAAQGFGLAARAAVGSGDWEDAAARLFAGWVNAYGIGAAAYVTEVDELELRVGRFGRPSYGGAAA